MDEAYTGSSIADSRGAAETDGHGSAKEETEALFADLLKDENEGLAVKTIPRHKHHSPFIGGCADSTILNPYLVLDNGLYK